MVDCISSSWLGFPRNKAPPTPRCVCVVDRMSTCLAVHSVSSAHVCIYHTDTPFFCCHWSSLNTGCWKHSSFRKCCSQQAQLTLLFPQAACRQTLLLSLLHIWPNAKYPRVQRNSEIQRVYTVSVEIWVNRLFLEALVVFKDQTRQTAGTLEGGTPYMVTRGKVGQQYSNQVLKLRTRLFIYSLLQPVVALVLHAKPRSLWCYAAKCSPYEMGMLCHSLYIFFIESCLIWVYFT